MSRVSAPADKHFRRAHVKPARKRRTWSALVRPAIGYGLTTLAVLLAAYYGTSLVAHAHVLQVDRIVVHCNERLSKGEILAVLNGLRGESLIWADLNGWRRRLLSSPWVRDAALRRSLPSTVEVLVWERRPIGIGRIDGEMYLIDDTGSIIDDYGPQYADIDLPIIDGLPAPIDGGTMTDSSRAELAARVLAEVTSKPEIARRVSQIDVRDLHNVSVILSGDTAVIQIGEQQFLSRLQSYLELAPALRERVASIEYVDLRFDGRVYVRPKDAVRKAGVVSKEKP